jgi:hypothetical protein
MLSEHRGAALVSIRLPSDDWTAAMNWIRRTPPSSHVLADPGHAWKYGTSVRVAGERDVYLEEVKDVALALYSRDVAMRVLGRIQDASGFDVITPDRARALAMQPDTPGDRPRQTCPGVSQRPISRLRALPPEMTRDTPLPRWKGGHWMTLCVGQASPVSGAACPQPRLRRRPARGAGSTLAETAMGASDYSAARAGKLERCALRAGIPTRHSPAASTPCG